MQVPARPRPRHHHHHRGVQLALLLTLCLSGAGYLGPVLAEHHQRPAEAAEIPPEIEAMLALAEPGEEHEFLRKRAGTWRTETRFWADPSQPPQATMGRSVNQMILGGRYLQSEFRSSFMGMPFQGLGIDGYDRVQNRFVSVWMDTMGTMIFVMTGKLDDSGKKLVMTSEFIDPATRKPTKMKTVNTIVSDDEHVFESYSPGPDGKMFRAMEIIYTRL